MANPAPDVHRPGLGRMLGRASLLRCPHCGGGPVLQSWFRMRARCPRCGMRLDRGEQDFFLGPMMLNIALSEGLLAIVFVGLAIALWPDVPWLAFQVGGILAMIAAPFAFLPFSRTSWIAFDLWVRPLTPQEIAWHHASADDEFRPERDR